MHEHYRLTTVRQTTDRQTGGRQYITDVMYVITFGKNMNIIFLSFSYVCVTLLIYFFCLLITERTGLQVPD